MFSSNPQLDSMDTSSAIQTPSHPKYCKKSVTFCNAVKVRRALHLVDYTEAEIKATWYDDDELKVIRNDIQWTAQRMMRGSKVSSADDAYRCSRGLECQTTTETRRRFAKRAFSRAAVLEAQDYQRRKGYSNTEVIARVYQEVCKSSQCEAHTVGLSDQNAALQIYVPESNAKKKFGDSLWWNNLNCPMNTTPLLSIKA